MGKLSPEAEAFLEHLHQRGRAGNTLSAYRRDLVAYERFLGRRGLGIGAAGAGDIASYLAELASAGRRPSTVARALATLRSMHRWCGSDAARSIERPGTDRPVPALGEDEVAALLDSVAGTAAAAARDRALVELLYATGARISEAVGLSVDDVGDGVVHLGGRRPRLVPYGEPAGDALQAWRRAGRREGLLGPAGASGEQHALFVNQRGGRLSRQWGWSVVRTAGERAGLDRRLGPHALRHAFATHLTARGAPPAVVQHLLGGQPGGGHIDELVRGYRDWHPRARRSTVAADL